MYFYTQFRLQVEAKNKQNIFPFYLLLNQMHLLLFSQLTKITILNDINKLIFKFVKLNCILTCNRCKYFYPNRCYLLLCVYTT